MQVHRIYVAHSTEYGTHQELLVASMDAECLHEAGGFTRWEAVGGWQPPGGKAEVEPCTVWEVVGCTQYGALLLGAFAAKLYDQEKVLVVSCHAQWELVP